MGAKKVAKVFIGFLLIGLGGTFLTSSTTFFYHTFTDLFLDIMMGLVIISISFLTMGYGFYLLFY
jgi:hypothetical protein